MTDFPKHEVSNIQRKQLWKKERFKAITKEKLIGNKLHVLLQGKITST
jgi:hypothetical protein